jgi:nucleotide-binding universal stress UspA family protein
MTGHGILVGVDGSPSATGALRWAVAEGFRRSVDVTAMLAWSYLDQHDADPGRGFDPAYTAAHAGDALATFVADALGPDHGLRLVAECDTPARALREAGRAHDLLVLGARGADGFHGLALGSTSEGVLGRASVPVALVRGPAGAGPVLAAVDDDGVAAHVLRHAVEAARRQDGRIVIVSAYDRPSYASWLFEDGSPLFERLARERQQFLEELVARIDRHRLDVECRVVGGNAAGAIVDAAAELDASLIVAGNRGHTGLSGAVLGSVSHQLVHHAPGVILLVH